LEKIVPRNILEVLKTVDMDSNELHSDIDTTGLLNIKKIFKINKFLFRYISLSMVEY
jgi:hypothetical protein